VGGKRLAQQQRPPAGDGEIDRRERARPPARADERRAAAVDDVNRASGYSPAVGGTSVCGDTPPIAVVIAGLGPPSRVNPTAGALYCATRASPSCGAIHPVRKKVFTKRMDPRVKPAGDGSLRGARLPLTRLAPSALATPLPARRGEGADRVRGSLTP